MKNSCTLDLLLRLAGERTALAARQLTSADAKQHQALARRELLSQLQQEYDRRMASALATGVRMHGWQNFASFTKKVDRAVLGQQQIVKDAELKHRQALREWQQQRQQEMRIETLAKRAHERERVAAARQEQGLMDEYAAAAARRLSGHG